MKKFTFEQKLLAGIVIVFLILIVGGLSLFMNMARPDLKASETIVESVTANEESLKKAAIAVGCQYAPGTFIGITEKCGVPEEPYDDIKGAFAEIPSGEEDVVYEQVADEAITFAANLHGINSIEVVDSDTIVFCKGISMVPGRGSHTFAEEGFFYAKDRNYEGIRNLYPMLEEFGSFQAYDAGYVALAGEESYLYIEPITGDFFYYDLWECN